MRRCDILPCGCHRVPQVLQKYIYGGHVSEYQETMQVRCEE
jgi:hypothetical protein